MKINLKPINVVIATAAFLFSHSLYSQSGQKWASGGNSLSKGDFLGSTNDFPLIFKVNNNQQMMLGDKGLQLNSLSGGSANSLLQTDLNGNVLLFPMGTSNQYLSGNGNWVNFPSIPPLLWQQSGSDIFYNTGHVGIGRTPASNFVLDVAGNAHVTNLYADQGVFIGIVNASDQILTDRLAVAKEVNAGLISSDTITTTSSKIDILQPVELAGDLKARSNLSVNGNATILGNLNVTGNTSFNNLDVGSGLNFGGGQNRIGYVAASNGGGGMFYTGNQPPPSTLGVPCSSYPSGSTGTSFGNNGAFLTYGAYVPSGTGVGFVTTAFDGANGIIESGQIFHSGSTPNLLLNYYCGSDVGICANAGSTGGSNGAGGIVVMGKNVEIGFPTRNSSAALNINGNTIIGSYNNVATTTAYLPTKKLVVNGDVCLANFNESSPTDGHANDGFSGLEILGSGHIPSRRGISLEPDANGDFNFYLNSEQGYPSGTVAPSEFNWKDGFNNRNLMTLNAGGQLILGSKDGDITKPTGNSSHANALLYVKGELVVGDNTGAKGIYLYQANWADFVFDKNYKLMPLSELENYYKSNHHLPNVPTTKDIQTNGNNLGETDAVLLQKIEENTLYIVELKKQLEAQQKLIDALSKKLADQK